MALRTQLKELGGIGIPPQPSTHPAPTYNDMVVKASALALMKEGYAVVFAGRRKDRLEAAANEGKGTPGKSLVVQTDVSNPEAIKALFAKTKETFGRLDVLFNNAGGGAPPVLLEDVTYEQWTTVVNANLTGVFLCTQEAFKIMKAQTPMGGRIINNGSISAHTPGPLQSCTSLLITANISSACECYFVKRFTSRTIGDRDEKKGALGRPLPNDERRA